MIRIAPTERRSGCGSVSGMNKRLESAGRFGREQQVVTRACCMTQLALALTRLTLELGVAIGSYAARQRSDQRSQRFSPMPSSASKGLSE